MNALCYKIVFSKRLGTLVAVGEHTVGQGKTASGSGVRNVVNGAVSSFIGALNTVFAAIALTFLTASFTASVGFAAGPAVNALPSGASVNSGSVAISSTSSSNAAVMNITQTTDKASVNWNSFNIGSAAHVNVQQNSASSVLLNRVVGNDPSQIFGKLSANGQVILINPNGIVFGSGGSVTASAFTASTFGLSEQDFANNKYKFTRSGSTAGVTVQDGATLNATAPGGYIALIGASVDNQGRISTQQGAVVLAAGESVALPASMTNNISVPLSGKVRLELLPSTINAMVANSGTITTEGGQVLMQAAALSDAVASVVHTGTIDTTGTQGGAVTLLTDGGIIKATGTIKANSKNAKNTGGDIIVGRDEVADVLAKSTNVSGALLESKGGFVETSGDYLKVDGISVKAKDWLLDPSDITISSSTNSNVTGTSPADITPNGSAGTSSIVSVGTIQTAINSGTNVTIKTTNASNATGAGNITIANALTFNNVGPTDATLSLIADNGITQNAGASITTIAASTKLVNVNMTANGNYQGNTAAHASSQGIVLNSSINTNGAVTLTGTNKNTAAGAGVQFGSGASISTKGAAVQITGTSTAGTGYGVGLFNTLIDAGITGDVSIIGTSAGNHGIYNPNGLTTNYNMKLVGRDVILTGTSSGAGKSGFFSVIGQGAGNIITAERDISLTGTTNSTTTGSGLKYANTNWQTLVNNYTAKGSVTLTGTNTAATNTDAAVYLFGVQAKTLGTGNVSVNASTQNAVVNAINIFSNPLQTSGYQGGSTSLVSTSGDVKIQSNQGSIVLNDGVPNSVTSTTISGRNISIDNTGGTIDPTSGAITKGSGRSTSSQAGIQIFDARAITATGNINLYGAGTSGNGVAISGAATLSATNINITGENTNATAGNAAINISNAASKLTSTAATALTSAGVGSGTSLVAAGNIAVGTQLRVTTPAAGTISGLISGTGSLLKMGAGQTKLTAFNGTTYGANTFSGGTTISQGTLLLGNGNGSYNNVAGTGAITLGDTSTGTNNVALLIDKGKDASQTSLSRAITVSNNGTGTATIGAATTGVAGGWTAINSTINLKRDVIINDATGDRFSIDGKISGTGGFTLTGGRMTMGSAVQNDFTGNVTINAGALLQSSTNANLAFSTSNNFIVNGEWRLNGSNPAINSLSGSGTVTTSGGAPLLSIGNNNGGGTFAGVISGGTKLIKNGSGTQILTGNNTYTGITTVSAGTLQIGKGGGTGTLGTGNVTLADGANLSYQRNVATTIANAITGVGNVTANITDGGLTVNNGINLTGNITLTGTNTAIDGVGVQINGVLLKATNIDVTGTATGANSVGNNAKGIKSTGTLNATNNITLTGTSSNTIATTGVGIEGGSVTALGDVVITGNNTTGLYQGVNIGGAVTGKSVTIKGDSSNQAGVYISQSVTSTNGAVTIEGTSINDRGIYVGNNTLTSKITSTSGAITITGKSTQQQGVLLDNHSTINAGGDVNITGTNIGTTPDANKRGVDLKGVISATQNVSIVGSITNAANNSAAALITKTVTASTGKIDITTSTKGGTNNALNLAASSSLIAATAVNIRTDSLFIDATASPATINAGTGTVTIKTDSSTGKIDIGAGDAGSATTSARTLGLTNAELNRITAANLVIGDANNTGGLKVSAATITNTTTGNLTLQTSGGMSITGALTAGNTTLKDITLLAKSSGTGLWHKALVKGDNITIQAESTATIGNILGYHGDGSAGQFDAKNSLNLTGVTASTGNGFYSFGGTYKAGTGIAITGTSANGQGVGFDANAKLINTTSGDILIKGTASDTAAANIGVNAKNTQGIGLRGVSIQNAGGKITLEALKGQIYSDTGNSAWGLGPLQNTITQNGTGDVKLTTIGNGNINVPLIVNNGAGNVVIAAGSDLLAGNGGGGQVKTVAGNTITQGNTTPGTTYIYSGNATDTSSLSAVGGFANGLFLSTIGSDFVNAASNTEYKTIGSPNPNMIAGGAKAQVMFREKVTLSGALNNATVTYGDSTNSAAVKAALQATNTGASNVISTASNAGTFKILNADLIADMATGKPSVDTALSLATNKSTSGNLKANSAGYGVDISGNKYTLNTTAKLVVGQKSISALYAANDKVYDGNNSATVVGSLQNTITGDLVNPTHTGATFDTFAVGTNKTVTVTGISLSGVDLANYKIDPAANPTFTATARAAITPSAPPPPAPVVPNNATSGRVKIPLSAANPFQLASAEELGEEDFCSDGSSGNSNSSCTCEDSKVAQDAQICFEKNTQKISVQ